MDVLLIRKNSGWLIEVKLLCSMWASVFYWGSQQGTHKGYNNWERPSHLSLFPRHCCGTDGHCSGLSVQTIQLHVVNLLAVQGMKPCREARCSWVYIPIEVVSHYVVDHYLVGCYLAVITVGPHLGPGKETCIVALIVKILFWCYFYCCYEVL